MADDKQPKQNQKQKPKASSAVSSGQQTATPKGNVASTKTTTQNKSTQTPQPTKQTKPQTTQQTTAQQRTTQQTTTQRSQQGPAQKSTSLNAYDRQQRFQITVLTDASIARNKVFLMLNLLGVVSVFLMVYLLQKMDVMGGGFAIGLLLVALLAFIGSFLFTLIALMFQPYHLGKNKAKMHTMKLLEFMAAMMLCVGILSISTVGCIEIYQEYKIVNHQM